MKSIQFITLSLLFNLLISYSINAQVTPEFFYATIQTNDANQLKKNHPDDITIIESINGFSAVMLTHNAAEELHHKVLVHGPGFVYEPSKASALATIRRTKSLVSKNIGTKFNKFSITQEQLVRQSLDLVDNMNIATHIQELEAYGTRYHTTNTARQAVLDLKTRWENMASGRNDVTVRIVNHTSTNMPSVVMTITGTDAPDEYVIIGGHIDSTAFGNNNNAPGADDNASGIATFTEAARVLFELNFKPKRTIEFMAFAAEEVGLRGSREIAEDYRTRNVDVLSFMQLDMTNYKGSPRDIYISTDSYNDDTLNNFLIELLNFYNGSGQHQLTYGTSQCNYGCSDHYSWAQQGYDVAFPFEASFNQSNPNIHTTGDTFDKSPTPNATHAAKFAKLALEYLIEISNGETTSSEECTQTINSFPYQESFETTSNLWIESVDDDLNFTRNTGTTPSNNTGPSNASAGNYYIYVEASGNGTGFPSKKAILESPCFDFTTLDTPQLNFDYHMLGNSIATLEVEAKTKEDNIWTTIFSKNGSQGSSWNTVDISMNNYANKSNIQIRFIVTTGSGNEGWQSDIAIDNILLDNGNTTTPPTCTSLNFNDFTISSFSNQDSDGTFSVLNSGESLSLTNNTWKSINYAYTVTSQTVLEFDFSSTSQGEIHGIGFENDNNLTSTNYFKLHGTQNYGVTNYDNYTNGTTKYIIPVGNFYTGNMDRLVFINDNDSGSGNTSLFTNVKIYEGTCGNNLVNKTDTSIDKVTIGNESESIFSKLTITPNPSKDFFNINLETLGTSPITVTLFTINGEEIITRNINSKTTRVSLKGLNLSSGIYLLKLNTNGEDTFSKQIIIN
ncbi:M20/M25/M40 family metallo-hydrolase [Tenacibaculum agarivorans]|uniref:M20/M25/M40 family metallo-hydrolase n=1 Tax=Tenacibaculum agarivorans TaxID=1908389 RepID=UPI00094BB94F|nr:M20/M25/M40 family metallo-hydrolase [Tenacibaculum agarivorans]